MFDQPLFFFFNISEIKMSLQEDLFFKNKY